MNIDIVDDGGTYEQDGRTTGPLRKGAVNEVIWTFPIRYGGSRELSVGLSFPSVGNGKWRIESMRLNGEVVEVLTSSEVREIGADKEIWTTPLSGHAGWLRIYGDGTDMKMTIERVYRTGARFRPKTKVGRTLDWVDFESISVNHPKVFSMGKSVALLRIFYPKSKGWCNGFVVSPSLLMTNAHCVKGNVRAITAHFDISGNVDHPSSSYKVKTTPVVESAKRNFDYLLLQVAKGERNLPEPLTLSNEDVPVGKAFGTALYPGEEAKVAVVTNCQAVAGEKLPDELPKSVWHTCDSIKKSSGHPIFFNGKVIALHKKGFRDDPEFNGATPTKSIIKDYTSQAKDKPDVQKLLDEIKVAGSS